MKFTGGEFSTGTTGNFQSELIHYPLFVPPFVLILLQIPFPGTPFVSHPYKIPGGVGVRWSVNSPFATRHFLGRTPRFHSALGTV
jgi:hypothetical protein